MRKNLWSLVVVSFVGISIAGISCATSTFGRNRRLAGGDPIDPTPPVIQSVFKPGELQSLCDAAIAKAQGTFDAIGKLSTELHDMDQTLLAFEQANADLSDATTPLIFMKNVSTVAATSQEAAACEDKVSQFGVAVFTRKDLYGVIRNQVPRSGAEARLLQQTLRAFEKAGLKLDDGSLAKVKELQQKLQTLQNQFETNLNNDQSTITCTPDEMKGAPADFLARLKTDAQGNYIVNTKEADYMQFIQNVISSDARRRMYIAFNSRVGDPNTQLLEQAIGLRQKIAAMIGFPTWMDYQTNGRMASDAKTVQTFLNGLKDKLAKKNQSDLSTLLDFKRAQYDLHASAVDPWDVGFLAYQYKKLNLAVDEEQIRNYFPVNTVVQGMFNVYSKLLGVNFREIAGATVWAEGVKQYEISDASTGEVIAYFYTDFYPRPLKYSHAASFPLIGGRQIGSRYSYPVAAIVANLTPGSNGKPALFSHDDVETLFHEFGHVMHGTLTRAPYESLSGTSVAQDFVEAPSQMLENWVWDPTILTMVSGNYQDPTQKLPADLLKRMISARDFNQGYNYTRQLVFALFDMQIHMATGTVDVNAVYNQLVHDVQGMDPVQGMQFPATFGHLMGGYDAGYYGYLWSEVYALDMFTRFKDGNILNSDVGLQYRRDILEEGDMTPAMDLVRAFLNREPNSNAFFDRLGIPHS